MIARGAAWLRSPPPPRRSCEPETSQNRYLLRCDLCRVRTSPRENRALPCCVGADKPAGAGADMYDIIESTSPQTCKPSARENPQSDNHHQTPPQHYLLVLGVCLHHGVESSTPLRPNFQPFRCPGLRALASAWTCTNADIDRATEIASRSDPPTRTAGITPVLAIET